LGEGGEGRVEVSTQGKRKKKSLLEYNIKIPEQ
jgi:hypothetical protein